LLYSCPWMAALVQDAVLALALPVAPAPGLAPLLLLELLAQPANPALAVSAAIAATLTTVIRLIRSPQNHKPFYSERAYCVPRSRRPP
jgi:hypothetical protein